MRVLHHAPAEQASDMSWHAVYQRLSLGDKSVDGDDDHHDHHDYDHDDDDHDDHSGADSYSIPPRIDFDPFSKLDICTDAAMNKKTKLKSIINLPEPVVNKTKAHKNKTATTSTAAATTAAGAGLSDAAAKTRRSNDSGDANVVVALYASIDGVVSMSDVDSMIKKKRIELRKGRCHSLCYEFIMMLIGMNEDE